MKFKFDYNEERNTVEWQRKKGHIMTRDNYTCQVCGAIDKMLHVHHTWYDQERHVWDYPDSQLLTLCCECHEKETILNRNYRKSRNQLSKDIVELLDSSLKKGIPLLKLINNLNQIQNKESFISTEILPQGDNISTKTNKSEGEIISSRINPSLSLKDQITQFAESYEDRCFTANEELNSRKLHPDCFLSNDRLIGKFLFDNKINMKVNRFRNSLGVIEYDIKPVHRYDLRVIKTLSRYDVSMLYEIQQYLKANDIYNEEKLKQLGKISAKDFCKEHSLTYATHMREDKLLKDCIDNLIPVIILGYYEGFMRIIVKGSSYRENNLFRVLNDLYGTNLIQTFTNKKINIAARVPYELLYEMNGLQFDLREDSFEDGTMKSLTIPAEFKELNYYKNEILRIANSPKD